MRWGIILAAWLVSFRIYSATVTLVTHGLDSNAQGWVLDMCRDIRLYQNALGQEADVYRVTLPRQNMVLRNLQFEVIESPIPTMLFMRLKSTEDRF